MAQTKIKAGLFEGIIGNGADGYFLMSNGDGTMTWSSIIINPTIDSIAYPGSVTAADPAGGETITVTGTGFKTGATVTVGGTAAPAVSYVSATQITFTTPAKAAGDYDIVITNTDTGSATYINGISYNGIPTWTTAAGSLGTFASDTTISTITLQATEPDAGTITFSITNGALPTGLSLTGANIDGTTTLETADTLYTFTVTATDDESQATPRTFTITVTKQFLSTENFTINTYTGTGSTQSIEGKIGTAAQFDGSSYIDLSTSASSFVSKSISFWFKYDPSQQTNASGYCGIYQEATTTSSPFNGIQVWSSYGNNGVLTVRTQGGNETTIVTPNANQWYHLCVTYDIINGARIYLNGSLTATISDTTNLSGIQYLRIGANFSAATQYYKGSLDQLRIFNKALSSSEVTTLYGENNTSTTKSTTDIFDDGSGVALYEFEKGAKDTGGVSGYIGTAGLFDGSSSYITINSTSTTPFDASSEDFSISAWINVSSFQSDACIISKWGSTSTNQSYFFGFNGSADNTKLIVYEKYGSSTNVMTSTSTTITTGSWFHIAYVRNSTQTIIYINGVAETFSNTNTINSGNSQPIIVGRQDGYPGTSFNGKIDQMRLFNKALSSSEITTLYGETSASATKSTTDIFDDGSGIALYELEGNANNSATYIDNVHTTNLKINLNTLVEDSYSGGSTWSDLTTNGNDGTIYGATLDGDSLKFGSGDYVNIPDTADIVNSNFTIETWFKLDSTTNQWNAIVGKGSSDASEELCLLVRPGNNVIYFDWGTGSQYVQPSYTWQANIWYHIAMTFGTNGIYFWVNGQKITGQSSNPGSTTSLTDDLRIGSARNNTLSMYGNISQFRYYDSVLSDSTIVSNYNSSSNPAFLNGTATNVLYAYDGTPTNVSFVGTSFEPDLVWIKSRGSARNHMLSTSVQQQYNYLSTNLTNAEATSSARITSLDSNGFTIGTSANVNETNIDFVAWCWKAGGTAVSNTDGSITSSVSANQDAGFSIVKWTGNETASQTIGHGLSSTPELAFIKQLDGTREWQAPLFNLNAGDYLILNSTAAKATDTARWSAIDSSIVTVGAQPHTNGTGSPYIGYFFHSVDGYQKVGSYTGTGQPNNDVTTGFRPRWVMIKNTSGEGWNIVDSIRNPSNPANLNIQANDSAVESSTGNPAIQVDFDDTGFSLVAPAGTAGEGQVNSNGSTYIYLAIA